ncbi:MAG TPA: glycosyltransferase family 4 protein [Bacteroidales bacterium]|nr:glycosyltransferase family 4 protein [Bacteroidales bacterium]
MANAERAKKREQVMICFFNTAKTWGGGEKWHFEIASALSDEGIPVILAAHKNSFLLHKATNKKLNTYSFTISNLSFLNPFRIYQLRRFFIKKEIKTVVLNLPSDMKSAGIAARLAGVNRIIYRRGSAIPIRNTLLNRFLFAKIITEVLANSYETKRTILSNNKNIIDPEKITVIYNGVKINELTHNNNRKSSSGSVVIGNLGRLEKQKAQHELIHLAKKLRNAGYQFKMLIGGDGSQKQVLLNKIQDERLQDHVVLTGYVDDIADFMGQIDIFILPSLWEGFGYVLAEAMMHEKPVVAYNCSSNPELIVDGETGFLADANNAEDLFYKTVRLIEDQELRIKMGKAGRLKVVQDFNFKTNFQKIKNFLIC